MGKKKVIAETGAGQHGVALATACALVGLPCEIYMGQVDIEKEAPNVTKMKILGCKLIPVTRGQGTLKDAVDDAFDEYLKDPENFIYAIGSVVSTPAAGRSREGARGRRGQVGREKKGRSKVAPISFLCIARSPTSGISHRCDGPRRPARRRTASKLDAGDGVVESIGGHPARPFCTPPAPPGHWPLPAISPHLPPCYPLCPAPPTRSQR
jgi:hypothetical protein